MAIVSNAHALLFLAIVSEEVQKEGPPVTTIKRWFGSQHIGETKALITDAVVSHRGVVTATVGDAVLCSFHDAQQGLDAALSIHKRMAEAADPMSPIVLRARIGLAYGPVRVEGGKVSGETVTLAGKMMEKCAAGDILFDEAFSAALGPITEPAIEPYTGIDGVQAHRIRGQSSAPAKPPTEIVFGFGGTEHRFSAEDGEINLGRGTDNDVIVPLPYVSRKHAKIVWRDDAPYLVNLSRNGSCVRAGPNAGEVACPAEMKLEGSGQLMLGASFRAAASPAEIVTYEVLMS